MSKAPPPPPAPDVKAIKNGTLPNQGQGRDNLLSSIQKGAALKKVPESEKKEPPPVNPKMEPKGKTNVQNKKTVPEPKKEIKKEEPKKPEVKKPEIKKEEPKKTRN